jgi:predicted RNA binding protein YcfA (HicA-like mRNA interferase family)
VIPRARLAVNLTIGYNRVVTWGQVIRKLKAAGYNEVRSGKGSHRLFKHATTGKEIWVAVHTKKDAGQLGNRILREAGIQ